MEPTDLTVRILQEIRDEQRATRAELRDLREELKEANARSDARFEVIETTLRDLAQQMVMLSRGIKTALESRGDLERRVTEAERRIDALEKAPH